MNNLLRRALISDNMYACPNCGHHFKPDWKYIITPQLINISWEYNKVILKCPECKIKDNCRRVNNK